MVIYKWIKMENTVVANIYKCMLKYSREKDTKGKGKIYEEN